MRPLRRAPLSGPVFAAAPAFALALALYGATRQEQTFSDGVHLASMVSGGPAPYYNAAYVPLGWLLHRAFAASVGWSVPDALGWLSALAGAAAVAVLAVTLHRLVRRVDAQRATPLALAWAALVALTPGTWFFATTVEVHSVQLLGAALATHLALAARDAQARRATALLAAACAAAMLTHLVHALLLPGLVVLARAGVGREPLRWRAAAARIGVVALVLALLGALVFLQARATDAQRATHANPAGVLVVFGRMLADGLRTRGLFGPSEVGAFLAAELLRPAGALALGLVALLFARRAGLRAGGLVAALPFLVVLPQGGIREDGAYYLSLYPLLALALADGTARWTGRRGAGLARVALALVVALALAQGAFGWRRLRAYDTGPGPLEWTRAIEQTTEADAYVITGSLPRMHALSSFGGSRLAVDARRELDLVPRRLWDAQIEKLLQGAGTALRAGRAVYVDADLLEGDARAEPVRRFADALRRLPLRLDPRPPQEPLVYAVSR